MKSFDLEQPIILLDAMGVIYRSGDDVEELLIPFIHEKGSIASKFEIENAYHQASLGKITATEFWCAVGLSSHFEDGYLSLHILNDGFEKFIHYLSSKNYHIACLSNDVSEWSKKLRIKFELERYIQDWIISGDVGFRKPDPNIYRVAITRLGVSPQQIIFIDDRLKNIQAAKEAGFQTILFTQEKVETKLSVCTSFEDLATKIKLG